MSNEKTPLEAMLEQYEKSTAPKYEKSETTNVFNEKNYFTIYDIPDNVKNLTKEIRILPNPKGGSPIVEFKGHVTTVGGKKTTLACLQSERNLPCPFCEAREVLLSSGDPQDKELAKKYNAREMYIVKLIDRSDEEHGPKFWRFNKDYRKEGVFDKIYGVSASLKKDKDISSTTAGRNLTLMIARNQSNVPIISTIVADDSSPLSEDKIKMDKWLADDRTWESVYSVKNYEYLELVVRGKIPVWDKENKCFVDKDEAKEAEINQDKDLDSELTLQTNVKANIKTAELKTTKADKNEDNLELDDMPF